MLRFLVTFVTFCCLVITSPMYSSFSVKSSNNQADLVFTNKYFFAGWFIPQKNAFSLGTLSDVQGSYISHTSMLIGYMISLPCAVYLENTFFATSTKTGTLSFIRLVGIFGALMMSMIYLQYQLKSPVKISEVMQKLSINQWVQVFRRPEFLVRT